MTLLFDPVPHKYFIKEDPTLSLKSVSHVITLLKPKFDPDGSILKKYVAKGKSFILKDLATKWELTTEEAQTKWGHLSFTEEEVSEIWKEKKDTSLVKGTKLHSIKEDLLLSKGGHPSLQDPETSYKKAYDLNNLLPGTYPELMLYYLPGLLTGTADIIDIDKNKGFDISDYKSNSKIEFESYQAYDKNTRTKKPKMMNPPISHLQDCNGIHYTVQLSLYAYFLEQFGYTCKSLTLIHLITDKDHNIIQEVKYPLEYIKKDIKKILFWYTNSIK
jgi:hypothetical protein